MRFTKYRPHPDMSLGWGRIDRMPDAVRDEFRREQLGVVKQSGRKVQVLEGPPDLGDVLLPGPNAQVQTGSTRARLPVQLRHCRCSSPPAQAYTSSAPLSASSLGKFPHVILHSILQVADTRNQGGLPCSGGNEGSR